MPEHPLTLALLIERFDPHAGGMERSLHQTALELTTRGHRVHVLAGWRPHRVGDLPFSLTTMRSGSQRFKTARDLRHFRDWALAHVNAGVGTQPFHASLSVNTLVPATVLQPRGGTVRETLDRNIALRSTPYKQAKKRLALQLNAKQRTLLRLERETLADPRVQRVVALSDYVARQLREHYAVPDDRIAIIPNAAAMPDATDAELAAWRDEARAGLNIPDDAPVFLFAAVNPRLKGFDPLLNAFAQLAHQRERDNLPAPILLLAGKMGQPHADAALRLNVRPHVRVLGPTSSMHQLYAAADLTVLPTFYDPSSKVVIESLMLGTPAITTAYNGAADFITATTPHRGRVINDPNDTAALAAAMTELCDPTHHAAAAAHCTPALADQLSMRRHVDVLEALLLQAGD